ncbi:MAG: hypothetical protein PF572_00785 [Patescibacteria group bacterium]|jgi:hypothetical protein|nr:hypothetical protein [Patescibacteria group bacterium]
MNNNEKIFQPEYSLKKENIFSLSKLPESLGERKKSLGWPVEIQGTGRVKEGTKDFEVHYPAGDVFLSLGVTIHELGHLRQEEFNPEIDQIEKEKEWGHYMEIKEQDAYQRGLERVKKYFPETLDEIEKKFQEYKNQGKLKNFSSFENLYDFLQGTININRALATIPEMENKDEEDRLEYEALKKADIEKFFSNVRESRVDEKIDEEWIEDFILKMAEKISNEQ